MKNRAMQLIAVAIITMFAAASAHAFSSTAEGRKLGDVSSEDSSVGSSKGSTAGENGGSSEGSLGGSIAGKKSISSGGSSEGSNSSGNNLDNEALEEDLDIYLVTGEITHTLFVRIEEARASGLVRPEMIDEEVVGSFIDRAVLFYN